MKRELLMTMMAASLAASTCLAAPDAPQAEATTKVEATPKAEAATGTPKIEIDRMVYDFGTTSLVSKLEGTFIISNSGSALLELKKPTTTCGCTVAALKTDKLAPGETTSLGFTMNVGNVPHGTAEKRITVGSNDPKSPSLQLTVKAVIVPVYDYTPQDIRFGDLHLGASTNFVVHVKRTDGKPLGISKVEAIGNNAQNIHAKLVVDEGGTNAATATIQVQLVADGSPRRVNNAIGLYAGDGKPPAVSIPIGGQFVGDVTFEPIAIYWAILDPANWPGTQGPAVTMKRVRITSNVTDHKFEVSNPVSSVPDVKVTVTQSEDSKSFELLATVEKAPKETVRGTIKVETNVKSQPTIEIPLTINVMNAAAMR